MRTHVRLLSVVVETLKANRLNRNRLEKKTHTHRKQTQQVNNEKGKAFFIANSSEYISS